MRWTTNTPSRWRSGIRTGLTCGALWRPIFGDSGGSRGIDRSFAEIETLLAKAGRPGRYPIKRGSDPITYRDRAPESEGVNFIIEQAMRATPAEPLWLVLLGPATDAAAALVKEPRIADRLVVFWHGRTQWPVRAWNFNACNDIKAVQTIFESPVRMVLFDTGTYLRLSMEEGAQRFASLGPLGAYLHEIRQRNPQWMSGKKGFFDLGDIAALVDPNSVRWERTSAPGVDRDLRYDFTRSHGDIVRIHHVERDRSFGLLEIALRRLADGGGASGRESARAGPVTVLLDTDMNSDCDDAGALGMLHALADLGEARILGVASGTNHRYSAGAISASVAPADSPVRRAYELWKARHKHTVNHSADQTAVLYAVRGADPYWREVRGGSLRVREDGWSEWVESPEREHSYLAAKMPFTDLAAIIDELMMRRPARRR